VVAIGEAAPEIAAAFSGACPVVEAGSMAAAVGRASAMAEPGDVVVLSPACASYDWYTSYGARGDDFARCVRALVPVAPADGADGADEADGAEGGHR
jgi:UDP-N-acetylmuramoylalanine--D-glutamate ligase